MLHESTAIAPTTPPVAQGLPILGNALKMRVDPLQYFVSLYKQHGSVFRVNVMGRSYHVMAGLEANRFLAREGETYLGSEALFGSMARELGSDALLVAIDGEPHRHQRKIQRKGFSRETILSKLPLVIEIVRQHTHRWQTGDQLPVFQKMQRMVTEQLAQLLTSSPVGDAFMDYWQLLNTNMKVHVIKTHPALFLKHPGYRKARSRATEFSRVVLKWHRQNPATTREPDLIDDLLAAVDENGNPYSENMLLTAISGAYFAGMDTVASTASFMLYAILKTPGLLPRLLTEIDEVFESKAGITGEALRKMDVLHHTAMETLRMYPVAPFSPRSVVAPFDFGGYHFEPGTQIFVANTVTHYLPEYFPNPDVFDVDRYDDPDYQSTPQAFAPFTLGAHTCLGAGMAEVQLMVTIATLLREIQFALDPQDYNITIYANPIPNPGTKFALKVVGRRQ